MSVGEDVERAVAVRQDPRVPPSERVALVDLLDRLLAGGVVIAGDVVISIAEIDLVRVSLRALITTVREEYDDILPH
ncbi:gas vesicle protein [Actinoallomurus spadix]|uniref:Gas vesicle protein n=1 Tax=Actinoallomurus spadix TaxID=79912 RepID=A0ABN0VZF6_9ACTN|nr:gas vesicle protein [Actinoallomurus spadix]MCO5988110.1 gas vesicle protein [Actinoallomurus spadix]